ncbi:uncharacterized protein LOC112515475 [Cynara cardunculus var. scolymus]|uniref:uncharacterized protein LOC112515475 n=1 Tax=Cynara cardunculus var. scolymus TaxID=59895 RepID=UPI000D627AD5|nr:uncharacterized protein LOC112515475 [Cynara cardunculus var. scolymus]
MERDQKKRTRSVDGGSGGHRKKEREAKGKDVENDPVVVVPAPTEDEVDEFFAILRRMRTAVKYFEKGKLSDPSRDAAAADDDVNNKKRTDGALLDLNTVPDERE